MGHKQDLVPVKKIEQTILLIRNQKVILDVDLARLYGVTTGRLNEQVKRNRDRFPADFMFRLTKKEKEEVIANCDNLQSLKFYRGLPYVFTEHGAMMAANVLKSRRAIGISVYVVRAFVKLREMVGTHRVLAQKLSELERRISSHDEQIQSLFEAIRRLMPPLRPHRRRIGFHPQ